MAIKEYFMDTSAFIAVIYEDDRYHDEAVLIQEELDRKGMRKFCYNTGTRNNSSVCL